MAAETIGRCRCPVCASDKARLSLAKSGLPVVTCNACNFQGFARSDNSDRQLRALLLPTAGLPAPAAAPAPAEPPPPAAPAAPPAPRGFSWGVLGGGL